METLYYILLPNSNVIDKYQKTSRVICFCRE